MKNNSERSVSDQIKALERSIRKFGDYDKSKQKKIDQLKLTKGE